MSEDDKLKIEVQLPVSWKSSIVKTWNIISGPARDTVFLYQQKMSLWQLQNAAITLDVAKSIAEKHGIELKPISPKFLIPFLEKAGLEPDNNVDLREAWAKLLINESCDSSALNIAFLEILSSITTTEASLISNLAKKLPATESGRIFKFGLDKTILVEKVEQRLKEFYEPFMGLGETPILDEVFAEFERVSADRSSFIGQPTRVSLPIFGKDGAIVGSQTGYSEVANKFGPSILVMTRLGLMETHTATFPWRTSSFIFSFDWLLLTDLGIEFYNACVADPRQNPIESQP